MQATFREKLQQFGDPEISNPPLFFINSFFLMDMLNGKKTEYNFQETDFLKEIIAASKRSRGKQ